MTLWTKDEAERIIRDVGARAAVDRAFRLLCLREPAAAIELVTGHPLPADATIRVIENAGAHLTIVLPDVGDPAIALSDAQLEQVAGGFVARNPWEPET